MNSNCTENCIAWEAICPPKANRTLAAINKVLYGLACWRFFIGYADERPAGVGVMYMHEGIASFTFAATVPDFRSIDVTKRDRRP